MDDAFIQSLQVTKGGRSAAPPSPGFAFRFMLLFLFHEIFLPTEDFPPQKKILRGKMAHRRDKFFYVEQVPVWKTAACPMGQKRYVFARQVPV